MKKSLGAKSLLYPAPVFVVGSYDKEGKPNFLTAAWGGIYCAQPPCVAVSLRRETYSHQNILKRKAFTISIPSEAHVKQVDYLGIISGRTTDKAAEAKLSVGKSKLVDAPFAKEFPIVLECKVIDAADLDMYTQFVGEVLDVKADDEVLSPEGSVDIEKLRPLIYAMDTQEYYGVGKKVGKVFSSGKEIL